MTDIRKQVEKAYADAIEGASSCCGEVHITDMSRGNYAKDVLQGKEDILNQSFGCGDPVKAAQLKEGDKVLDLGSGAGVDLIIAAKAVGQTGHVYGLDMTSQMHKKAQANLQRLSVTNATLLKGFLEDIPLYDNSVNVIISNCVINLSPDKNKVLAETLRVLQPGGKLIVSDVVLNKPVPEALRDNPAFWSG